MSRPSIATFRIDRCVCHVFDEELAVRLFREIRLGNPQPNLKNTELFDIFSAESVPSENEQTQSSAKSKGKGKEKARKTNTDAKNNHIHSKTNHAKSNDEPKHNSPTCHASANTNAAGKGFPPGIFRHNTAGMMRNAPYAHSRECSRRGTSPGPQPLPAAQSCSVTTCSSVSLTPLTWDPFETGDHHGEMP